MAQFQLQENAAERYERWVVPIVDHSIALPLLDLTDVRRATALAGLLAGLLGLTLARAGGGLRPAGENLR